MILHSLKSSELPILGEISEIATFCPMKSARLSAVAVEEPFAAQLRAASAAQATADAKRRSAAQAAVKQVGCEDAVVGIWSMLMA